MPWQSNRGGPKIIGRISLTPQNLIFWFVYGFALPPCQIPRLAASVAYAGYWYPPWLEFQKRFIWKICFIFKVCNMYCCVNDCQNKWSGKLGNYSKWTCINKMLEPVTMTFSRFLCLFLLLVYSESIFYLNWYVLLFLAIFQLIQSIRATWKKTSTFPASVAHSHCVLCVVLHCRCNCTLLLSLRLLLIYFVIYVKLLNCSKYVWICLLCVLGNNDSSLMSPEMVY